MEGTVYTILVRIEKKCSSRLRRKSQSLDLRENFTRAKGEQELKGFWERWTFLEEKMNEIKEKRNV